MLRVLPILVAVMLGGCRSNTASPTGKIFEGRYPIRVVCTTGMVADVVKNVGGAHVQVEQLLPHGTDPHQYKATPGDVRKLKNADMIFYSGLHLEGKMTDVFESLARTIPTLAVAERLAPEKLLHDDDDAHDPHVWFNVQLWSETADGVRDQLVRFDPNHADDYRKGCTDYQMELAELHAYAARRIQEVPPAQRVLITSHDAFQYFGKAYGIEVKGIQGISTEAEASVGHITELVNFIVERKVKAVFVETSVNPRNMKALIEGCTAKKHTVREGGTLFSDAMGPADEPTGRYVGMIKHNVDVIVEALK